MSTSTVPFGDLAREYAAIRAEVDAAVAAVLARGRFLLGEEGEGFEREFAEWLGVEHVVACASGTEASPLPTTKILVVSMKLWSKPEVKADRP